MHNPARYENESQASYKARRLDSKAAVRQITAHNINKGLQNSRKVLRDSMRSSGTMGKRTRAYVALMAHWASKRITKAKLRDEHGAYTLVGRREPLYFTDDFHPRKTVAAWRTGRRVWLAGISAQRGF